LFEVTATIGEGTGESLNRLPVSPHERILADAGYCSVAGIEYVWQHGADVLVRVNPQSFVAYTQIQQAVEPHLSLQQTLYSWKQIAQALAEKPRKRRLQLAKWHASY